MTWSMPPAMPSELGVKPAAALSATFLTHAFTWMFAGLLVTAAIAGLVQSNDALLSFAAGNLILVILGQLALVMVISAGINRLNASLALGLFFVYAATLGLTVGLIVSFYTAESVMAAFLGSSAMFGAAAIYGATTKRSLASLRGYLFMAVIGLVVAMVVNLFLGSGPLGYLISVVGVVVFVALTAYDVQRISSGDLAAQTGSLEKAAVIGALRLYLDFINLFLFLLRLVGDRR